MSGRLRPTEGVRSLFCTLRALQGLCDFQPSQGRGSRAVSGRSRGSAVLLQPPPRRASHLPGSSRGRARIYPAGRRGLLGSRPERSLESEEFMGSALHVLFHPSVTCLQRKAALSTVGTRSRRWYVGGAVHTERYPVVCELWAEKSSPPLAPGSCGVCVFTRLQRAPREERRRKKGKPRRPVGLRPLLSHRGGMDDTGREADGQGGRATPCGVRDLPLHTGRGPGKGAMPTGCSKLLTTIHCIGSS